MGYEEPIDPRVTPGESAKWSERSGEPSVSVSPDGSLRVVSGEREIHGLSILPLLAGRSSEVRSRGNRSLAGVSLSCPFVLAVSAERHRDVARSVAGREPPRPDLTGSLGVRRTHECQCKCAHGGGLACAVVSENDVPPGRVGPSEVELEAPYRAQVLDRQSFNVHGAVRGRMRAPWHAPRKHATSPRHRKRAEGTALIFLEFEVAPRGRQFPARVDRVVSAEKAIRRRRARGGGGRRRARGRR